MGFEFGEEEEGVEGLELVEVGGAEGVEDGLVDNGECGGEWARRPDRGAGQRVRRRRRSGAGCGGRGAGSEFFAEALLFGFVAGEYLAGAGDDIGGKAGEASNFDAVALVGGAGFDAAEEDDLVAEFADRDMHIADAGNETLEFGELVIVGGEEGARAGAIFEGFDDGPGDG